LIDDDFERSAIPFWRAELLPATSRPLTFEDMQRADAVSPSIQTMLVSRPMLEGAGRGIGWPDLDAHFEAIARGAAHTIFGNIALDVPQAVTAYDAGLYALAGTWPFAAVEWSAPRQDWDD
jgi:hypothetical protein